MAAPVAFPPPAAVPAAAPMLTVADVVERVHDGIVLITISDAAGQDVAFDASLERLDEHVSRLTVNGRGYQLTTAIHGSVHVVEVDGVTRRSVATRHGGGVRVARAVSRAGAEAAGLAGQRPW